MKKKPTCTTYEISKTSQIDLSEEASQIPLQKDLPNLSKTSPKPLRIIFPKRPLKNLYEEISKTSPKLLQNLSELSFQEMSKIISKHLSKSDHFSTKKDHLEWSFQTSSTSRKRCFWDVWEISVFCWGFFI